MEVLYTRQVMDLIFQIGNLLYIQVLKIHLHVCRILINNFQMMCQNLQMFNYCAVLKITGVPTVVVQTKLFARSVNYLYVLIVEKR